MYVDYRIINEKEVVAINEEVESVKITGPNTGDIKKAMLLYNKIDGMKMKIIIQNKEMEDLNDEIAEIKETRNKEIPGTILSTILFAVFITNAFPIGFLIATGLISVVGLTGITLNNKKIKNYGINHLAISIDLNITITLQVLVPLYHDHFKENYTIPLVYEIIEGEVPSWYQN